ncbi:alternative ribosome rescue aminoacyl-tRNA hydrolase ArfB [Flavobacterium sp.]|uniref:alternative ribosome rescue aminoacyl-tRNA hydrolase ArfB n=1 Tax=Flavobacterium sp. TaxID=239 RepID=UPI0037501C3A
MDKEKIITELSYKAVRSSGAGGQNVNKVSSKVVLTFDLLNSLALTDEEKERSQKKLKSKLTLDGILILNCDEDRSQVKNKTIITKRFIAIIEKSLIIPKPRKATKIPKAVIEKRLKDKSSTAEIKSNRKKPEL